MHIFTAFPGMTALPSFKMSYFVIYFILKKLLTTKNILHCHTCNVFLSVLRFDTEQQTVLDTAHVPVDVYV